jgi:hypothetical protein
LETFCTAIEDAVTPKKWRKVKSVWTKHLCFGGASFCSKCLVHWLWDEWEFLGTPKHYCFMKDRQPGFMTIFRLMTNANSSFKTPSTTWCSATRQDVT